MVSRAALLVLWLALISKRNVDAHLVPDMPPCGHGIYSRSGETHRCVIPLLSLPSPQDTGAYKKCAAAPSTDYRIDMKFAGFNSDEQTEEQTGVIIGPIDMKFAGFISEEQTEKVCPKNATSPWEPMERACVLKSFWEPRKGVQARVICTALERNEVGYEWTQPDPSSVKDPGRILEVLGMQGRCDTACNIAPTPKLDAWRGCTCHSHHENGSSNCDDWVQKCKFMIPPPNFEYEFSGPEPPEPPETFHLSTMDIIFLSVLGLVLVVVAIVLTRLCNKTMEDEVYWTRAQMLHKVCCWQSCLCSTSYALRGDRIAMHMKEYEEEPHGNETDTTDLESDNSASED